MKSNRSLLSSSNVIVIHAEKPENKGNTAATLGGGAGEAPQGPVAMMEAAHIKETAEWISARLAEVPPMDRPFTIGVMVKPVSNSDPDKIVAEQTAKRWEATARRLNPNIVYVVEVDDGTDESLRRFKTRLDEAGNHKERTFAWVLSNEARKRPDNKAMRELAESGHLAGLDGEYIPVSWQVLAGPLFAGLIDLKNRDQKDGQERVVGAIIDSIARMTGTGAGSWSGLKAELLAMPAADLPKKFNGIAFMLRLPKLAPLADELEQFRLADESVRTSM